VLYVERYDKNPNSPLFLGNLSNITYEELSSLDKRGTGRMIARMLGIETHTERMLQSLLAVGKTVVSWPQLGATALLNSAVVAYCVRKIALGEPLPSCRTVISLDEKFVPNYHTEEEKQKRETIFANFRKILEIEE
jgi:hypothetical protein